MPRVYVEFSGLKQAENRCKDISSKVDTIRSDFQHTIQQLDWDVRFESNINNTASKISKKLDQYARALNACQSFLEETHNAYAKLDAYKGNSLGDLVSLGKINYAALTPLGPGGCPSADWKDQMDEDFLETLKALLKSYDKWGNVKEAGALKDVISYFESFKDFFTGDKKGITGASDWFDLADSSVNVWEGLYDYFADTYSGLKTGFFGDIAKKNVKILGLSGEFLGLTASILSASNELDTKQWQSIVADYIDCGKDIVSIIDSGYELKHIGDIKSLADIKAGPWSAMNVYTAIGESAIRSIAQGFRSHEKYYADGTWDLGDTGATGIDISMAGIYGISHSLTLGLDDLIFGAIDSATGGSGNTDMTYYEKAAEGYKILARECGQAIGNWWVELTT